MDDGSSSGPGSTGGPRAGRRRGPPGRALGGAQQSSRCCRLPRTSITRTLPPLEVTGKAAVPLENALSLAEEEEEEEEA
jgi:hypothetical protein